MGLCLGYGGKSEIRTKVIHKKIKVEDKRLLSRIWDSKNSQLFST